METKFSKEINGKKMKKSKEIIVLKYVLSWKSGRNHPFLSWKKGNSFSSLLRAFRAMDIPLTLDMGEIGRVSLC